jgi:hypothetical protein
MWHLALAIADASTADIPVWPAGRKAGCFDRYWSQQDIKMRAMSHIK